METRKINRAEEGWKVEIDRATATQRNSRKNNLPLRGNALRDYLLGIEVSGVGCLGVDLGQK